MDVKVLKLITGEELIGDYQAIDSDGNMLLKHPLGIGLNHEEQRLVFMPYMPYTTAPEEIVVFPGSLMFAPLDPVESIVKDYERTIDQIFGPKIMMPERSIIRPIGK